MSRQKPLLVEFTGTPEAGKTTTISIIYKQLISMGYKVRIYPESAEITPGFIPKGSKIQLFISSKSLSNIIDIETAGSKRTISLLIYFSFKIS